MDAQSRRREVQHSYGNHVRSEIKANHTSLFALVNRSERTNCCCISYGNMRVGAINWSTVCMQIWLCNSGMRMLISLEYSICTQRYSWGCCPVTQHTMWCLKSLHHFWLIVMNQFGNSIIMLLTQRRHKIQPLCRHNSSVPVSVDCLCAPPSCNTIGTWCGPHM